MRPEYLPLNSWNVSEKQKNVARGEHFGIYIVDKLTLALDYKLHTKTYDSHHFFSPYFLAAVKPLLYKLALGSRKRGRP